MRTCFVHIGMHKTGSTAIQSAFHGYDDGKTVMLRIGKPNHTWPLLMMFSARAEWAAKRSGARIADLDAHVRVLRETMVAQFEASQSNFVISGEGLSNDLTQTEIAAFKKFLAIWFDEIRIIVYLRDPASYMRSAYQQSAKSSAVAFDLDLFQPRYRDRVSGWTTVFGPHELDAVMFDRRDFDNGSIIHDFARRIGADVTRVGLTDKNESLRAEGFAVTYALRNDIASGGLSPTQWVQRRADLYMSRTFGKVEFDFSDQLYDVALAKQKNDIAWAEHLLKRPFPPRRRATNAVVFGSHDDILRYAAECRAEFRDWKRRQFGPGRRLSYLARAVRHRLMSAVHRSRI